MLLLAENPKSVNFLSLSKRVSRETGQVVTGFIPTDVVSRIPLAKQN